MALVGDDCFFFLNSGCVRGSQCTFRHQPAARNTTIVCPQWLQRCCFKPNCLLRHTDDIVSRNQTPCYFEASQGVCWKPRCAFAHVRKQAIHVPIPPPPPVLPALLPPGLPALPPVLPSIPPGLPTTVGISAIPPHAPLAANLPLPNNTPIARPEVLVVGENHVPNVSTAVHAQTLKDPITTAPPGLPSPSKLTEMLLGTKLPPPVKEAVVTPEQHQPHVAAVVPTPVPSVATCNVPAADPSKPVVVPSAVFPKSDHFNEQVRRFKEMLAVKSTQRQKKSKDDYSDEESDHQIKERQRSKRDRREKEGHKSSSKSRKEIKEKWSKAEEEILFGDYKDVPLDKKHKKKKHKEPKEYTERANTEPEVQVKSYEEILREKALRKLYSRRKEKFNEDFKELVDDNTAQKQLLDQSVKDNDGLPDKVIHRNKRYNSDGDEVNSSDSDINEDCDKRSSKTTDSTRNHQSDHSKGNDAQYESESRHRKRSKKHSKKKKHKSKRSGADEKVDLIEIHSNDGESQTEQTRGNKISSEDNDNDSDSYGDSETEVNSKRKREEIIIPDETTNIDFNVDLDDDLAMEINQSGKSESVSKSKKLISSVVVPISANSSDKKQNKKLNNSRTSKKIYSNNQEDNTQNAQSEPKKVVRLVNRVGVPKLQEQPKATVKPVKTVNSNNAVEAKATVKDIKVKSFDEIMAEKQKKKSNQSENNMMNEDNAADSPVNSTLKEKSTRAKLEILNVYKADNGSAVSKALTDDEKQKRKSMQLYKPPHPAPTDKPVVKTTEVKMVVNTGPRKIIRIRKATLSTDIIDQDEPVEESVEVNSSEKKSDSKETVKVRSFEEIIKEKRARQRRERELARQLEKENSTNETKSASATNNLIRRKPVIRRQVPAAVNSSAISKTLTIEPSEPSARSNVTTVDDKNTSRVNTTEAERILHSDTNVAKVSPLNVVPPKQMKCDDKTASVLNVKTRTEHKEPAKRLQSNASRRFSISKSFESCNDADRLSVRKTRKRSIASSNEHSNPSLPSQNSCEDRLLSDVNDLRSEISLDATSESQLTSRRDIKDIQEALDENRRKREEDLLSDEEFEKEINELGSDDDDDNFDDMDEDDLMMELEQMIDS